VVTAPFDISQMDVTPFYFSAASCNGGQGTTGTDAWQNYYAVYQRAGELYVQQLREDGAPTPNLPRLGTLAGYNNIAAAQAGPGVLVAAQYSTTWIDLYYVGPGPTARTLGGASYQNLINATGSTVSSLRVVRGNGGRAVVLWRETDGAAVTKIRFARMSFAGTGTAWTATVVTPPTDLITIAGNNGNFGVASSHEEYGDTLGCPQGLAKFAVAYREAEVLKLAVYNEDGTVVTPAVNVFSGTAIDSPVDPDVAWTYAGGDRWAVLFSRSNSNFNDEVLNFWQSAATSSAIFGAFSSGNGKDSISEARIVARPTEFLVSALVHASTTLTQEPQIRIGKLGPTGTTLLPLTQATVFANCTGTACVNGTKRLARPLSSAGGTSKTTGAMLYGSSALKVSSSVMGCN
jgi:hypothetical protein